MLNLTLVTKQTGPAGAVWEGAITSVRPCSNKFVVEADAVTAQAK
jgi:hypothetical protein